MDTDKQQISSEILGYWARIFPTTPLDQWQLDYWSERYSAGLAIESLGVAVKKHERLLAENKPMSYERFCSFATGVMRNKAIQRERGERLLPAPCKPRSFAPEGYDGL